MPASFMTNWFAGLNVRDPVHLRAGLTEAVKLTKNCLLKDRLQSFQRNMSMAGEVHFATVL